MVESRILRAARASVAAGRSSAAQGGGRRSRQAGLRLWTLLNAQALIRGPVGEACIEDDRRRLAARRER